MQNHEAPVIIEVLIHLLELSVVIGIGVIIYINKKYSPKINQSFKVEDSSEN